MKKLNQIIRQYMQNITLILTVLILLIMLAVQILNEQHRALENATETFEQMEQILSENESDLADIKEEYSQTCLHDAEAIAYIIEENPDVLESVDELKKIAAFMEVDEIHIFDETGRIFTGTHPEYYGYTFDSGEQISFFKPLLEDKSLQLVQDIMPNTAESKMMQYSALWSKNGKFIVQVGMEPVDVVKATKKNELSYIFSLLRVNPEASYYVVDKDSLEIVGSTDVDEVGKNITEIGLTANDITKDKKGFFATVNDEGSYCVFTKTDDDYIGYILSKRILYQRIPMTMITFALSLALVAVFLIFAVTRCTKRYIINEIHNVNKKLSLITKGNLDETVEIQNSVEFSELSSYINEMVKSLLNNNRKMSYVLSKTNMYIGVYEYNKHMKKVHFTEYIPKIFSLNETQSDILSHDYRLFQKFMEELHKHPVPDENGVFRLNQEKEQYVRLEEISDDEEEIFGVAIDVTDDVCKRRKIESERDIDPLTGLYNRRGIDHKLSELFRNPESLGGSAIMMIDADGLKIVNDTYGHEKGDIYLNSLSDILKSFGEEHSIAARQGGDEFVLLLYHYNEEEELQNKLDELAYLQNHSFAQLDENLRVPLRFSMGYSLIKGQGNYQDLLGEADKKMYANKRERKKQT